MHREQVATVLVVGLILALGRGPGQAATPCRACTAPGGPRTDAVVFAEFTSWKLWTLGSTIDKLDANSYTHIIYTTVNPTGAQCTLTSTYTETQMAFGTSALGEDPNLPYRGLFSQLTLLKRRYPHLRTILSVGGYDLSSDLSDTAANQTLRAQLAASCASLMVQYGFDGLDLNWQYPRGGKTGNAVSPDDPSNHVALVDAFRSAMPSGSQLIVSVSYSGMNPIDRYDLPGLIPSADYILIRSSVLYGGWNTVIGHISNLAYAGPNSPHDRSVIQDLNRALIDNHIPSCMIILAIPSFGMGWTLASTPRALDMASFYATGQATFDSSGGSDNGQSYIDVDFANMTPSNGWAEIWDETAQAAVLYRNETRSLISYDSTRALMAKVQWGSDHDLGGYLISDVNDDLIIRRVTSTLNQTLISLRPCSNTTTRIWVKPTWTSTKSVSSTQRQVLSSSSSSLSSSLTLSPSSSALSPSTLSPSSSLSPSTLSPSSSLSPSTLSPSSSLSPSTLSPSSLLSSSKSALISKSSNAPRFRRTDTLNSSAPSLPPPAPIGTSLYVWRIQVMLYYDIRQIPDDQLRTEYDVLRRVLSRTLKVGADRFTMIQLQANNDGSATLTFLILPRSSQTEAVEGNQIADQFTSEMQNMVSSLRRSSLLVYASPPPTQVMVSSVFALRCDVDSYKEVHTPTDRCATASAASSSSSSSSSLSLSVLVVVAGVILGLVCTGIVIWVAVRASPSTALAGRDKVTTQTGTATASSPAFYFGDWTDINGTGPRLDANPNGQQMATRPVSVVHTMPSAEAVLVPINGQYHHFLQASPYSGLAGWAVSSPKHHANDRQ